MKQVVFAIAMLAMASLTGCLNTEDSPVDENIDTTDDSTSDTTEDNSDTTDDTKEDELIEPVGVTGYTPPENSNIRMDYGAFGAQINPSNDYSYWYDCEEQGWYVAPQDSGQYFYCDLDYHYDNGPQIWVNKTGKIVTIECIKNHLGDKCKNYYLSYSYNAYLVFYSNEGFTERIKVPLSTYFDDETTFYRSEVSLKFEPVWFSTEEEGYGLPDSVDELYTPGKTNSRIF